MPTCRAPGTGGFTTETQRAQRGDGDRILRLVTIPFRNLTPFAFVRDMATSIAFYRTIGFEVGGRFPEDGPDALNWAWLQSEGGAQLMIARATEPVIAEQQAVFFYLYVDDVAAKRAELAAAGVTVGEIATPFYAPRGEFRVVDPDGYALMITHT
jgi:catechol 2,3-dioxygenase-like lactoylglutathione lyase family enzyme